MIKLFVKYVLWNNSFCDMLIFHLQINIFFSPLKLEIALAIPALNDWKINTINSAGHGLSLTIVWLNCLLLLFCSFVQNIHIMKNIHFIKNIHSIKNRHFPNWIVRLNEQSSEHILSMDGCFIYTNKSNKYICTCIYKRAGSVKSHESQLNIKPTIKYMFAMISW